MPSSRSFFCKLLNLIFVINGTDVLVWGSVCIALASESIAANTVLTPVDVSSEYKVFPSFLVMTALNASPKPFFFS